MSAAVAKRYARALSAVAREQNRLEETASELKAVIAEMADPEISLALVSPALNEQARRAVLSRLAEALGLSELVGNFLSLLADHHRLKQLTEISRSYDEIVDRDLGRARGVLRSATPLGADKIAEIARQLSQASGKKVELTLEVHPTLIGGVSVELEGRVYDGSVRTQLQRLARTLSREGAAA